MNNDSKKNSSDLDRLLKTSQAEEEGGEGSLFGGTGGQTGSIEFRFHDTLSSPSRDDTLPPNEIRRLMKVHAGVHEGLVSKQKFLLEQRAALKQHDTSPRIRASAKGSFGMGFSMAMGMQGGAAQFKKHPISDKAQFSGVDKQVSGLPNENEANTNDELKNKLQNQLQHRLQNVPKFNPQFRPPGT